jgi:hypothetical protein
MRESMEVLVIRAQQEQLGQLVKQASLGYKDSKVYRGRTDNPGKMHYTGYLDRSAHMGPPEQPVPPVVQGVLEVTVSTVVRVRQAQLDQRERQVPPVPQWVQVVLWGCRVNRVHEVPLV